jgi:hypothetical protein
MGMCKYKPLDGIPPEELALVFGFERSPLLGRVVVDFDPGPELRIGIFSEAEFDATFDVIQE